MWSSKNLRPNDPGSKVVSYSIHVSRRICRTWSGADAIRPTKLRDPSSTSGLRSRSEVMQMISRYLENVLVGLRLKCVSFFCSAVPFFLFEQ